MLIWLVKLKTGMANAYGIHVGKMMIVVSWIAATTGMSLIHEIGHLLGTQHDRGNANLVSISSTFCEQLLHQYSCIKKLQIVQNVTREKLHKTLLYKKGVLKMLMKLTPGAGAIAFEFDT